MVPAKDFIIYKNFLLIELWHLSIILLIFDLREEFLFYISSFTA